MFAGDHDAILVLLLIPRLVAKIDLIVTQIKEKVRAEHHGLFIKFPSSVSCSHWFIGRFMFYFQHEFPDSVERSDVIKSQKTDIVSFAKLLEQKLCRMQGCLRQYNSFNL